MSRCAWTLFNFRLPLLQSLRGRGHLVRAWGSTGDGYEQRLTAAGVDFSGIGLSRRAIAPLSDARLVAELVGRFRRERPALVHCFTIKPAIFGTIAAWFAKVPVRVVTITGLGHAFTSARPAVRFVVTRLYRFALSRADFVFFQNAEDRRSFVELGLVAPERSGVVAGSGVDIERFKPVPLPALSSGSGRVRFLMLARMIREKGVLEFLAAADKVRLTDPDAEFVLVGREDTRNPTALNDAELNAVRESRSVKWAGPADDVRPFIEEADIVVLPSYREGLPRVLLEAGSMGRPVIATDVTGCRDVVIDGTTGYLVPAKDPAALAEAMQRFCRDRQSIERMGAAGRQHVVNGYDERAVIEVTLAKYESLLAARLYDAEASAAER